MTIADRILNPENFNGESPIFWEIAASTGIEWATKAIIAMVVISAVVKSKVLMAAIVEYSSVKNAVMRGIIASPGRLKNFIKGENKFCKKIIIGEYLISTTSM